jgi:hypothetical protein
MKKLAIFTAVAALVMAFGFASPASAFDFGSGPGCSAIEGVLATNLASGDTFTGRIGTTAVSGYNKNGKPADNSDDDAFTDSIEECINDALVGYVTEVFVFDTAAITVVQGPTSGRNDNKQDFTVTFNTSGFLSACSDHVDNDNDTFTDYPADSECTDYSDTDESS